MTSPEPTPRPAPPTVLRLGTRTSRLATWQADHVAAELEAAWPGLVVEKVPFVTEGDKVLDKPLPEIGGKGLFTVELEAALGAGRIDLAVHSLKDLPTDDPPGLTVGATTRREDPRDAWICPAGGGVDDLPPGATVGTSSLRRGSQLLRRRPDLVIRSIRGNVETRIRKVKEGGYHAGVLALAGLSRLEIEGEAASILDLDTMLPAPGQAALGVQVRADDDAVRRLVGALDHAETRAAVTAERQFLASLGGGCSAPIAAYGTVENGRLHLRGRVVSLDGARTVEVEAEAPFDPHHPARAGREVGEAAAQDALAQGAAAVLAEASA
ncbi:hydroxymethylbilane synthase [Rubrivirga litoralis]|uniref:Porphobilinogen deaminase n=1 Tax=Rubrivirga litoralis TaxID=3075598 RepID=A0ABU3BTV7_9BACT|nr:hydroxymethylbilane synthase [Rubrivirga sp. F394]MDT0632708.1 hydroxymethylbilane synthase [Rubrivirga sp. F394]